MNQYESIISDPFDLSCFAGLWPLILFHFKLGIPVMELVPQWSGMILLWESYESRGFIEDHLKYHASFLTGVLRWCPDPEHPLAASVYSVDPESKSLGHCHHAGFFPCNFVILCNHYPVSIWFSKARRCRCLWWDGGAREGKCDLMWCTVLVSPF